MTYTDYQEMALQHLRELWTNYGKLEEYFLDGGCPFQKPLTSLLEELQPEMAVFGGAKDRTPKEWKETSQTTSQSYCNVKYPMF